MSNKEDSLSNKDAVVAKLGEVVAIDAPYSAGDDGYKWFSLPEEPDFTAARAMTELGESAKYVVEKMREMKMDEREMILFGASQGGAMALYLTLTGMIRPLTTIAAVPFYFHELADKVENKETPILWIAAGRDERIPRDVGALWKNISAAGANLKYCIDPGSEHNVWTASFNYKILEYALPIIKRMGR